LEVSVDHGVRRQESLGMTRRFEPLHLSLAPPRRSMRILSAIVQVAACPMTHIGQYRSLSNAIAAQAIGDKAPRLVSILAAGA
jgi:hypothetical protein